MPACSRSQRILPGLWDCALFFQGGALVNQPILTQVQGLPQEMGLHGLCECIS